MRHVLMQGSGICDTLVNFGHGIAKVWNESKMYVNCLHVSFIIIIWDT